MLISPLSCSSSVSTLGFGQATHVQQVSLNAARADALAAAEAAMAELTTLQTEHEAQLAAVKVR